MLETFPANPQPEDVHALRTHTRRLEATIAALIVEQGKAPRRVLKLITPVRKAAGKVRDMDVLIEDVLALVVNRGDEGLVRLAEHLGKLRAKNAKRLRHAVTRRRRKTSTHLKELSRLLKKRLKDDSGTLRGDAAPQILVTELTQWPTLNADNLHAFRLRIKELRYMLELSDEADKKWIARLGDVKDAIGEWHDWVELLRIAKHVLDPSLDGGVLKRIDEINEDKYHFAVTSANRMREGIFRAPKSARNGHRGLRTPAISAATTDH
jgi:CHAD domain-containing protein